MNNNVYWKPIASAPKDGTRILIASFNPDTDRLEDEFLISIAYYDRPRPTCSENNPKPYWHYEGIGKGIGMCEGRFFSSGRTVSEETVCRAQIPVFWAELPHPSVLPREAKSWGKTIALEEES